MFADPLKSAATIATMAVAVLVVGIGAFFWWQNHSARNLAVAEQGKAGAATVSAGQSAAQTNAIQIQVAGEARDRVDLEVHEQNAQVIAAAPGAAIRLDPGVNLAGLRSLCQHRAAYGADPRCAGLLGGDPAQLPGAGASDSAAAH